MKNLKLIYSILFLKGKSGSSIEEISSLIKLDKSMVTKLVDSLKEELQKSWQPLSLNIYGDKVKLSINEELSKELSLIFEKTNEFKLSKPLLEVLTIIAYKQPTTKPEIEKIRGVSSETPIRKLLDFDLIKENGRANTPGMPILFQTTDKFLETFNIKTLKDLPPFDSTFENISVDGGDLFSND